MVDGVSWLGDLYLIEPVGLVGSMRLISCDSYLCIAEW